MARTTDDRKMGSPLTVAEEKERVISMLREAVTSTTIGGSPLSSIQEKSDYSYVWSAIRRKFEQTA